MGGLNPGNGYTLDRSLAGVSLDILPNRGPKQQFQVTPHKAGSDWYLAIEPGWAQRVECASLITSSGNRSISIGGQSIADFNDFGKLWRYEINKVNCYKAKRYASLANDLSLGQQYICDETETLVVLYAPQPGSNVRLAVIGATAYANTFNYSGYAGALGATAVAQIRSGSEVTVTKDGNGKVTDVALNFDSTTYWERIALMTKPLARFNKSTRKLTVYNIGPQSFDSPSETYAIDVAYASVGTAPTLIDADWAAAFYVTGDANGPSGYNFDY